MTRFLSLLTAATIFAGPALADSPKWNYWNWPPGHFKNLDFERRLLEGPKLPHNEQWNDRDWTPADWIAQRETEIELIEGFYKADVIRDQRVKNNVPYLYIGEAFYMLSGYDKRRLAEAVDAVYGITEAGEDEVFVIYDDRIDETIGFYTNRGLQLQ